MRGLWGRCKQATWRSKEGGEDQADGALGRWMRVQGHVEHMSPWGCQTCGHSAGGMGHVEHMSPRGCQTCGHGVGGMGQWPHAD